MFEGRKIGRIFRPGAGVPEDRPLDVEHYRGDCRSGHSQSRIRGNEGRGQSGVRRALAGVAAATQAGKSDA